MTSDEHDTAEGRELVQHPDNTNTDLGEILEDLYNGGWVDAGEPSLYHRKSIQPAQALAAINTIIARERLDELEAIAPDMRTHPEYKGYVETSISGKWQPLSDRIAALKNGEGKHE